MKLYKWKKNQNLYYQLCTNIFQIAYDAIIK